MSCLNDTLKLKEESSIVISSKLLSKKNILVVFRENNIGHTGVTKYFDGILEALEKKSFSIDKLYNSEKSGYLLTFLRMLFIDPLKVLAMSKNYDLIIMASDLLANNILFVPRKSIIVLHHVVQDIENSSSYNCKSLVDIFLTAYRIYTHKIIQYSRGIIFPSKFSQTDYLNRYPNAKEKSEVIHPPFDFSLYAKKNVDSLQLFKKYEIPFDENVRYMLYVGTEAVRKNFITVLKALTLMRDESITLIKVGYPGTARTRSDHELYIKRHALNVHFIDYLDDDDLVNFYNVCDLYVNTSLFEGFGRSPIEAQACGLPVISSHCGALKEVLEDSAYILKNPTDPVELKKAILILLSDRILRESYVRKGFENVRRFSLEKQIAKWECLLNSMLADQTTKNSEKILYKHKKGNLVTKEDRKL